MGFSFLHNKDTFKFLVLNRSHKNIKSPLKERTFISSAWEKKGGGDFRLTATSAPSRSLKDRKEHFALWVFSHSLPRAVKKLGGCSYSNLTVKETEARRNGYFSKRNSQWQAEEQCVHHMSKCHVWNSPQV